MTLTMPSKVTLLHIT